MFTFFTTNEANTALPDVIKKFEYSLAKNTEVKKILMKQECAVNVVKHKTVLNQQYTKN